jgi:multiple sugar transport system permease protein/N,N'-diacetylchitobiose transport system permease protein
MTKKWKPYGYLLPSFIVIFGVILYPLAYALFISFIDLTRNVRKLDDPSLWNFVGLENYRAVLADPEFWHTLGRTFYFTVVSVGLEFALGMAFALLLNEKFAGRGIVRGLMLIPWAFPTIVNAVLWKWLYDPNHGTVTMLLAKLGLTDGSFNILGSSFSAMNAIIIADVWKNTAFVALILLAALQSLPIDVYEAAMMDGASAFRRFFKITLPLLSPSILVALVIRTMEAFKVFDIIYIMTGGGPAGGTQVLSFLTYQQSMAFGKYSVGASISYVMSIFIAIFAFAYIKILYKRAD